MDHLPWGRPRWLTSYRIGLTGRVDQRAVQLCELIEPARISAADTAVLAELEEIAAGDGVCLVMYRSPIRPIAGQWPPV